ncbi:MAG TPA: maleylpyruvate isomerase N-terminal domain-containing protein, partial [Ktedonobacterales bacterium]|nr:maleylpyruvate isomerase N-terminal domain-containing protein [Ktedonobacterales bacterium]
MLPAAPIAVVDLFPELQARLLDFLAGLSEEQWRLPTVCAGWSVKDVALHLLGGNVSNLSRRRDGLTDALTAYAPAGTDLSDHDALVAALNAWNEDWVVATRRMSPCVLCHLLAVTGNDLNAYYRGLDLLAMGDPVGWIGPEPVPVWVDIAREYSEHWMHQAQMRDATGDRGIREPRLFSAVLATFMLALPHALRDVAAPEGTRLRVVITGAAGGEWSAVRRSERWEMDGSMATEAAAIATLDEEDAWRLWTRGLPTDVAARAIQATGDARLAGALRE